MFIHILLNISSPKNETALIEAEPEVVSKVKQKLNLPECATNADIFKMEEQLQSDLSLKLLISAYKNYIEIIARQAERNENAHKNSNDSSLWRKSKSSKKSTGKERPYDQICAATENNDLEQLKLLLSTEKYYDFNSYYYRDSSYSSPLLNAIRHNNLEMIKLIMSFGFRAIAGIYRESRYEIQHVLFPKLYQCGESTFKLILSYFSFIDKEKGKIPRVIKNNILHNALISFNSASVDEREKRKVRLLDVMHCLNSSDLKGLEETNCNLLAQFFLEQNIDCYSVFPQIYAEQIEKRMNILIAKRTQKSKRKRHEIINKEDRDEIPTPSLAKKSMHGFWSQSVADQNSNINNQSHLGVDNSNNTLFDWESAQFFGIGTTSSHQQFWGEATSDMQPVEQTTSNNINTHDEIDESLFSNDWYDQHTWI